MSELTIDRKFAAPPEKVFEFITRSEHLVKWWGPEGVSLADYSMNFTGLGPWHSVMQNSDGKRFKVSGVVIAVDVPRSVELTWAWHDENDVRGHESTVRFEVTASGDGGTAFRLIQSGLDDDESAKSHDGGWSSSFNRLEKLAS